MPLTVHTVSLGCPKNRVDTEFMLACLGPETKPVDDPAEADLVLVNTCGFIEPAVNESLETIVGLAAQLSDIAGPGPRPLLAVIGCLVTRYGAAELAREMPEVDFWLGVRELHRFAERIGEALGRRHPDIRLDPLPSPARRLSTGPSHAYLKIAEGCGHHCSFCTIPSIRGPLASRPADSLVDEARQLLTQVPELILVAQDTTAWGRDLGIDAGLPSLLHKLLDLPGLQRLRLMYLYPAGLTPDLLDCMAQAGPVLVPYFDVPLQHAHPDILSAMGRPFARDPRKVLDRIRARLPEAAVRTSIITGFPGETDKHFKALEDFVAQARFHHLGVFQYCDEDDAASFALPGKVPAEMAAARRDALMEIQAGISAEIMEQYVGRTLDIVVDEPHPDWEGLFTGRAWFQAPEVDGVTYVSGPGTIPGKLVQAEVVEAQTYDLVALTEPENE